MKRNMAMTGLKDKVHKGWGKLRTSRSFHAVGVWLVFVVIAAAFWVILALNDNMMHGIDVKVNIYNVPDSTVFINDPPADMHVVVRAKGTQLVRNGMFNTSAVNINFKDFSQNGVFRFTSKDIQTALKSTFGAQAQILSVSVDSIRCVYTQLRGRRVPVEISLDVTASSGHYVSPVRSISPSYVTVYSANQDILDTVTRVFTKKIVRRNLTENVSVGTSLVGIPGARFIPSAVQVGIKVEPLVSKETMVQVEVMNVPEGEEVVLFPSKVAVLYYVPMSYFNDVQSGLEISVDYSDIKRIYSKKLPVRLKHIPDVINNVRIEQDSVEYTLVK